MGIPEMFRDDIEARRWFDIIGPRADTPPVTFKTGARWTGHATDAELLDLAKLQKRIEMREQAARELRAARNQIMMRCIRRMRREEGKE